MTVKNYLIRSLYKINSAVGINPGAQPSITSTDYRVYKKMHDLTLPTLEKHIGGEWELVLFEGEVEHAQQMHKEVFMRTYQMWSEQPCNILFVDLDIMAFGPIDFFNQYNDFTMFSQIGDEALNGYPLDQYYNCGLRYFPHTIDSAVWDLGLSLYKEWPDKGCEWDRDQLVYSKMLLSQPNFVFPNVAINSFYMSYDVNPEFLKQYKLLHFHSSKGPRAVHALMKRYLEESGQQ